jgi:hypothetical protein
MNIKNENNNKIINENKTVDEDNNKEEEYLNKINLEYNI